MKKIVSGIVLCLLLSLGFSLTAFAHGHHGNAHSTAKVTYAVCDVDDCNLDYNHTHNNSNYYGHTVDDGHEHHAVCQNSDCTATTAHEHDGSSYFGHHANDGHNYHNQEDTASCRRACKNRCM